MRKIKKENYYVLGIVTFVILAMLMIQNLIVFSTEQLKEPSGKQSRSVATSTSTTTTGFAGHTGGSSAVGSMTEVSSFNNMGARDPSMNPAGGAGMFCIGQGTSFATGGATLASLQAGPKEIIGYYEVVSTYTSIKVRSLPQLKCTASHVNILGGLGPSLAGAVASGGDHNAIQFALWEQGGGKSLQSPSGDNLSLGSDKPFDASNYSIPSGTDVVKSASTSYESFSQEIDSYNLHDSGGNTNLTIDSSEALVQVDYDSQYLIIGPITIDYPSSDMGGVTNMYMEGMNSFGSTVNSKENMEILSYGNSADSVDQELKYASVDKSTSKMKDGERAYPSPREGFYVKINNPNQGINLTATSSYTQKIQTVTKIKMHYDYEWSELTGIYADFFEAITYEMTWVGPTEVGRGGCRHSHTVACRRYFCAHSHDSDCYDEDDELDCPHSCNNDCGADWGNCKHQCDNEKTLCWLYKVTKSVAPVPDSVQPHMEITDIEYTSYKVSIDEEIEVTSEVEITVETEVNVGVGGGDYTMMLGGTVWEDTLQGKDNIANGIKDSSDRVLPNVKVTLYEVEKGKEGQKSGKVAGLILNNKANANIMNTINPTYTNEKGEYLFVGVNPLKKYYVEFEYNGQTYIPTEYTRDLSTYNRTAWEISSKGTETTSERNEYNTRFAEIGSSPANYKVPNGALQIAPLVNGYNEAFSQYDLMGFEMTESGDYRQGTRLIDSFYKIENGNIVETNTIVEGEISKAIRNFILSNRKSPSNSDLVNIYKQIAGGNQETLRKLQFISDTKVHSYTQTQGASRYDLYPVYNKFTLNVKQYLPAGFYPGIYGGQLYINQGLVRREEVDVALRKDVLYAATRINGKTEVYGYNDRDEQQLTEEQKAQLKVKREELKQLRQVYEQNGRPSADYTAYLAKKAEIEQLQNSGSSYWQIQLRMRDYNNYYDASKNYARELYQADYNYRSTNTNKAGEDKDLQVYVTYKITIRNGSQSVLNEITEIVDYYDKDYAYRDDLSWVMYKNDSNGNNLEELNFTEADYYDTIKALSLQGNIKNNNKGTQSSVAGRYETRSSACKSDMTTDYNAVYIKGLEGKALTVGEEAYVYLTFEVDKNKNTGKLITDDGKYENDNTLKQNYAEINGYKTYYKDGTKLPNNVTTGSRAKPGEGIKGLDVAGLIDINSTPGNLCKNDLQGNKYEKNFENDTDRAKSIKVTVEENYIRSMNGIVWEDQRTEIVSNAIVGDGVRQNNEVKVNGVTVELVERLENGSEYVWQHTTSGSGEGRRINVETGQWENYTYTKEDGKYEFSQTITGNYFVRFKYGDIVDTADIEKNGGKNKTSYNGQDFKSTVYQKDMTGKSGEQEITGYTGMKVEGYEGKYAENEVGYYDIRQSDEFKNHLSDAKDLWNNAKVKYVDGTEATLNGRQGVIDYSNNNVTNSIAETLASPYTDKSTDEFRSKTQMTAVTGLIVLEGEYNRTDTNGDSSIGEGNNKNGNYTLNNVDFGLTERPKAQLEIDKRITNVKITLANGNILFDANEAMTDLTWVKGTPYKLNEAIQNNKYPEFYGANNHRYAYRKDVDNLVASKYQANGNNGLIVATMDEELMQGGNIRITYEMTVTNVGETDYEGQDFYYKGTGATKVVTTRPDIVTDYVSNNLIFQANNNNETGWEVVENRNALGLNDKLTDSVKKYNNIIATKNFAENLTPGGSSTVGLVLTQIITPQSSKDDKTYDNIAEITTISNTVGRRMAYSIQGNQDPTQKPNEVDSIKSERLMILPPFGIGDVMVYVAVTIVALAVLAISIIFIKKNVIKT